MNHTHFAQRLTAAVVALCMAFTLCTPTLAAMPDLPALAAAPLAAENVGGTPLTLSGNGSFDVTAGNDVILTGTPAEGFKLKIDTMSGQTTTVTLSSVVIDNSQTGHKKGSDTDTTTGGIPGLLVTGDGDLVLHLEGNNVLRGGPLCAGLQKESTGSLTIDGSGSLTASSACDGAGIGGGSGKEGANITINGGTITANGGPREYASSDGGAGIGGGSNGAGSYITINGGTVKAYGGSSSMDNGHIVVSGYGAGIGGGIGGDASHISITNGTVMAYGGSNAAAIGSGMNGDATDLSITGDTITVQSGNYGACIGTGNVYKAGGSGGSGKAVLDGVTLTGITYLNSDGQPAGPVEICTSNFPDKNFCKYLKEEKATYIYNTDSDVFGNYISETDRLGAKLDDIDCSNRSISDLTGIALFPHLKTLDCSHNSIRKLDLRGNKELKTLTCTNNKLTALDVTKCTALTELDCSDNSGLFRAYVENYGGYYSPGPDLSKNTNLQKLVCNRISDPAPGNTIMTTFWI